MRFLRGDLSTLARPGMLLARQSLRDMNMPGRENQSGRWVKSFNMADKREHGHTDAGCVYTGQGWPATSGSMAASMAPATCIVRSSVDVRTHISLGSTTRINPK